MNYKKPIFFRDIYLRNEFNSYSSYTSITWVGTDYAL